MKQHFGLLRYNVPSWINSRSVDGSSTRVIEDLHGSLLGSRKTNGDKLAYKAMMFELRFILWAFWWMKCFDAFTSSSSSLSSPFLPYVHTSTWNCIFGPRPNQDWCHRHTLLRPIGFDLKPLQLVQINTLTPTPMSFLHLSRYLRVNSISRGTHAEFTNRTKNIDVYHYFRKYGE